MAKMSLEWLKCFRTIQNISRTEFCGHSLDNSKDIVNKDTEFCGHSRLCGDLHSSRNILDTSTDILTVLKTF